MFVSHCHLSSILFKTSDDGIFNAKVKVDEMKLSGPLICMKPPQPSSDLAQSASESKTESNDLKSLKTQLREKVFSKGREMGIQVKK